MVSKKLQNIHEQSCIRISKALAKLTDKHAIVDIINPKVERIDAVTLPIRSEEIVAAVRLPVSGEVTGAALLLFCEETAFNLSDLLIKKEFGTTKQLDELDRSALEELGNILKNKKERWTLRSRRLSIVST